MEPAAQDSPAAAEDGISPAGVADLLRNLFDPQMRTIVTTRMLPLIYTVGMVLGAVFVLYLIFKAFQYSMLDGALWLVLVGPALFLAWVIFVRVVLELVTAAFRIVVQMESVESTTQNIAGRTQILDELPRITFWRGRRRKDEP